jgi:hypothetical protein
MNQGGGELIDFIIVLRSIQAVKAFSGRLHVSIGAGVSASVGPLGRAAEADLRVGSGGAAACYTYSCSQGMLSDSTSTIICYMLEFWERYQNTRGISPIYKNGPICSKLPPTKIKIHLLN